MGKYSLAILHDDVSDISIKEAVFFNCILPFYSFGLTVRVLDDETIRRWSGICAIVNVATMVGAASAVGYLGYHNAVQLCSMVFEGMNIPAQALSVIAVGSTVLACAAAAYTSCIIMQNVVAAPVAHFVCKPNEEITNRVTNTVTNFIMPITEESSDLSV
jgi:hypothetical protein